MNVVATGPILLQPWGLQKLQITAQRLSDQSNSGGVGGVVAEVRVDQEALPTLPPSKWSGAAANKISGPTEEQVSAQICGLVCGAGHQVESVGDGGLNGDPGAVRPFHADSKDQGRESVFVVKCWSRGDGTYVRFAL